MKKGDTVYLVVYSHRFGNDHMIFIHKEKAERVKKELEASYDFAPERDEYVEIEELQLK